MTWPTDMDTARMQATINQQAERIFQLEDQVTRLQSLVCYLDDAYLACYLDDAYSGEYGHSGGNRKAIEKEYNDYIRPGDLDPIE